MSDEGRQAWGAQAEGLAVSYLRERGYRIRARNFRCPWGELDIVAERDGLLCVVEVRMRSRATWGCPSATVSASKQRRVVKATLHFLRTERLGRVAIRFDVISVLGRGSDAVVEHIPNAFDAGF